MVRVNGTKKALAATMLFSMTTLLSGCFSKEDLRQPIAHYLSDNYGIQDFTILSADNNWFEGIDHQTYIEIKKPYRTFVYLRVERDTDKVDRRIDGDDVYEELFTSAFVEQHPKVYEKSEELIKKYHLLETSPYHEALKEDRYYFIQTTIKEEQEKPLLEQFKKQQEIKTDTILPTLEQDDRTKGVINFTFYFNTYKNTGEVPQADSLVQDFAESRVLPEGIYSVNITRAEIDEKGSSSIGIDQHYSSVLFHVNRLGDLQVLKTIHGQNEFFDAQHSE